MSQDNPGEKGTGAPLPVPAVGWGAPPSPSENNGSGGPALNSNGWGVPPAGANGGDWGALAAAPRTSSPGHPGTSTTGGDTPDYFAGDKMALFGLNQNLAAALGYVVGLPALLCIFMEPKEHRFLRFHAFQAVLVGVAAVVACVATYIPILIFNLSGLALFLLPAIVLFLSLPALGIFGFIATIKAFQGKAWKIPKLGIFAERLAMR